MRPRTLVLGVMIGAGVMVSAACGSSYKAPAAGGSTATTAGSTATTAAGTATTGGAGQTISLRQTSLGYVLSDATGRTVYMFEKDSATSSNCTGGCTSTWPPLTVSDQPTAGANLDASKLTTITRSDGSKQVVYAGHPLYRYGADAAPGDVKGEGIGNFWFAVMADGSAAQPPASASSSGY